MLYVFRAHNESHIVSYLVEMEVNNKIETIVSVQNRTTVDFVNVPIGVLLQFRVRLKNDAGVSDASPTLELFIG